MARAHAPRRSSPASIGRRRGASTSASSASSAPSRRREVIADVVTFGTVLPMLIALLVGWYAGQAPTGRPTEAPDAGPDAAPRRDRRRSWSGASLAPAGVHRRHRQPELDPGERPPAARRRSCGSTWTRRVGSARPGRRLRAARHGRRRPAPAAARPIARAISIGLVVTGHRASWSRSCRAVLGNIGLGFLRDVLYTRRRPDARRLHHRLRRW